MASWTHAVFPSASDARSAVARLSEAGVDGGDIEVRSSIPLHDISPAGHEPRTKVPLMAVLGGFLGGTGGFLLSSLTSLAYPLPTGGMPIVALPPSGIITFEGTAIGAILCTVATVIYEGELLNFRKAPRPVDRFLAAGNVIVSVRSTAAPDGEWAADALLTEAESD